MRVLIVRQYLERIKEDDNNSKLVKLKAGELPWNTPYWYKHIKLVDGKRTITIDTEKLHIVREIFRRYATGTCSIQSLATEINKEFGTNFQKKQ